jgi:hypothetical protein
MKSRIAKTGMVLLALTLGIAAIGVGYGLWAQTLTVDGTVNTGTMNVVFVDAPNGYGTDGYSPSADDDNKIDGPWDDPRDNGYCAFPGDDDADGAIDEDPIDGVNNDHDGELNPLGTESDGPGPDGPCVDGLDNDLDGYVDRFDSDCWLEEWIDEDPPGKATSCDPRDHCDWIPGTPYDDDGDGSIDEDGPDGTVALDNDGDGLIDEDPPGGYWDCLTPPQPTAGPDLGTATATVDGTGKILTASLKKGYAYGDGSYSPTIHFEVTNTGSVPATIEEIVIDYTNAYDWHDLDGSGSILDAAPLNVCDPGDECTFAVLAELSGDAVIGATIDPGQKIAGTLKLTMTEASWPGHNYSLTMEIIAINYNEAGGS